MCISRHLSIITEEAASTFKMVLDQMKIEIQNSELAQYEFLISYLKIFLITASRLKNITIRRNEIGSRF